MKRKVIPAVGLLSIVLSTILSLSVFSSGIGIAKADSVIATIPVGSHPLTSAFNPDNGDMYVTNQGSNTVTVIDGKTNTVIGSPIPVGTGTSHISFDPANGNLYVTNGGSNTVTVIDGKTNTVIGSPIPVGTNPEGIAFNPNNGDMYVVDHTSDSISVIDSKANTVIARIQLAGGSEMHEIAFNPNNGNMYLPNEFPDTVTVIDGKTNTVAGSPIPVPAGSHPWGIAFNPNNGNMYVANWRGGSNTVTVIDGKTNTVIGSPIPVGSGPLGIAFNPNNGNMYVTNEGSNTVTVIDGKTNTVVGSPIPVGTNPSGITFNPNNGDMYVANYDFSSNRADDTVSVISTTTIRTTPPDTTIISAVDGNRATVQNAGTTLSTSIHFTFTAKPGTNPIAGFECRLDNSAFSPCTSPTTLTNLPAGKHNFQVRAVDTAGNRDPTPASFSWTILTPAQGIQQLIQLIQSMGLNHGTQTSLTAPLNAALSQLTNNNPNSVGTACNQLNAFVNHVNADGQNGQLSSTQAIQLIHAAQNIQTALGCTVALSANGIGPLSTSSSSLNLTQSQQKQPQTMASSPSLLKPQSQSPYPYSNQYRYPSQYPQSQLTQRQQLPPVANAGMSQNVNENTKVTLDGRASYSPSGGVVVAYEWTQLAAGVPVILTGANTATPTFTTAAVPIDTPLAFSLRVMDNNGAVSTNPTIVYVMVKHNISNIPAISSNGINQIQKQQQQQLPLPTPHSPNIPTQPAPPNTFDFPQRHLR